jgi:hypothetical protein
MSVLSLIILMITEFVDCRMCAHLLWVFPGGTLTERSGGVFCDGYASSPVAASLLADPAVRKAIAHNYCASKLEQVPIG